MPVGKIKRTQVQADKPLKAYAGKRDFTRTPEPVASSDRSGDGREFVMQKHAARRLHYDLRLEMDGVLKSWPKRDPTVTSPQLQSAHATIAFLSIICGTTAVPPRLQHIRRGRCRGRRFRHPSIGRSFHPDFVRTTS